MNPSPKERTQGEKEITFKKGRKKYNKPRQTRKKADPHKENSNVRDIKN